MAKDCLGNYQPGGQCDVCPLAFQCIDVAIEADGYYDQLAEKEEALWELLEDAAIRAATR